MKKKTKRKKRVLRKRFVIEDSFKEVLIEEIPPGSGDGVIEYVPTFYIRDKSKRKYLRGEWDLEHAGILVNALNQKACKYLIPKLRYE